MIRIGWLRFSGLFKRRLGWALLSTVLVASASITVNVLGIHVVGDVEGWQLWLQAHAHYFLAWRLCLYGATAYGWWWMRARLRQREPSNDSRQRLRRVELAALLTILLLEGRVFLEQR